MIKCVRGLVFALPTLSLLCVGSAGADEVERLAASCAACHAPSGQGAAIPALYGRPAKELREALRAFAQGEREGGVMALMARSLDDRQRVLLAEWFAKGQP